MPKCKSNHVQDLNTKNYKMPIIKEDLNESGSSWIGKPTIIKVFILQIHTQV